MVFSTISAYLDPANWQQQAGHSIPNSHQFPSAASQPTPPPSLPCPPPAQLVPHVGSSIRPGSMADRARLANIPMTEAVQKCPRCESTNTKFCYFNNYSLSQPRHFCKTCRRYWTRGGALRSVPVGGGCRRNKRSTNNTCVKAGNNASKAPASSSISTENSGSTSNNNSFSTTSSAASLLGLMTPHIQPLRFLSPLGQLMSTDHNNFTPNENYNNNNVESMNFQLGNLEQWRLQQQQAIASQFPNFYGGLDTSSTCGVYPIQGGYDIRPRISNPMLAQLASMKMEDINLQNHSSNILSRQFLGSDTTASAWNDISASIGSSSTSNAL